MALQFILSMIIPTYSTAANLNDYMSKIKEVNPQIQAQIKAIEASESKKFQGDLVLNPQLIGKLSFVDDKKDQPIPSLMGTRTINQEVQFGVSKKFLTGTTMSLLDNYQNTQVDGTLMGSVKSNKNYYTLSLAQPLWKDSFGHSNDLRHSRELSQEKMEKMYSQMILGQFLQDAEAQFWDYLYLKADKELKESSIKRAQDLEAWTKRRYENGIADKSDYLQIQALVAQRKLQLVSSEDDLTAQIKKMRSFLELSEKENLPDYEENFKKERLSFGGNKVRYDVIASKYEASLKQVVVSEVHESLKPDLSIEAAYMSLPTTSVALKFSMPIDTTVTNEVKKAAQLDYQSSQLKYERKKQESDLGWDELKRRHKELSKRIEITQQLVDTQKAKVQREREKLMQGRTTTFQVISFEQESQESEVALLKLHVEQRKLESQTHLFGEQL